jgi:hypothetical protein
MRTYFKNMIQAYRGKCDGLVYYFNPRLNRIICRAHVIPRESANSRRFARISRNLKALAPSDGYKADLAVYANLYNFQAGNFGRRLQNWYNAYTRLMWNLAKADPETVDLETLTRAQILALDLPCVTVRRAVEAGLLEPVSGYELLTQEM